MAMTMCGESFYRYDNGNVLGVFLSVWQWQCVGSLFIGMAMAMCGESFYRYGNGNGNVKGCLKKVDQCKANLYIIVFLIC